MMFICTLEQSDSLSDKNNPILAKPGLILSIHGQLSFFSYPKQARNFKTYLSRT